MCCPGKEETQTYAETLEAYLDTMARMRNATLCLVPSGYTATSRRFYEALENGCAPQGSPARVSAAVAAIPDGVQRHWHRLGSPG